MKNLDCEKKNTAKLFKEQIFINVGGEILSYPHENANWRNGVLAAKGVSAARHKNIVRAGGISWDMLCNTWVILIRMNAVLTKRHNKWSQRRL